MKQLALQDVMKPKYNCQGKKWQQLTYSMEFCIAKDMIEKESFRKPLYMFDRATQLKIPNLYSQTQDKVVADRIFFSQVTLHYLNYTIIFYRRRL